MKTTPAITFWILRHPSGQSSLFASLRPLRGFGLDRPCGAPPEGNYVMARGIRSDEQLELNPHSGTKGGIAMFDRTPSAVDVTIGGETRIYEAFVTTAPVTLDRPSTVTLEESSFASVAHLAAEPITFDATLGQRPARLVLIANADLKLQKACYREGHYLLAPADPVLVGRNTLQEWLWDRLAMPSDQEMH